MATSPSFSIRYDPMEIQSPKNIQIQLPPISTRHLQSEKKKTQIQNLTCKLNDLKMKMIPDLQSSSNFNLIKWDNTKKSRIQQDPQIATSRIKKFENDFQLNRAQIQIQKRSLSKTKKAILKYKNNSFLNSSNSYLCNKIFKEEQYKKVQSYISSILNPNQDQSQYEQQQFQNIKVSGLNHYEQLKRTPKFLSYILNKLQDEKIKQKLQKNQKKILEQQKAAQMKYHQKIKKQYQQATKIHLKNSIVESNPQKIIQKQYPKFFSKMIDNNQFQIYKTKQSCQSIIKKQMQLTNQSIQMTKQNKRKLRQKFNKIVKDIAKTDRYSSATTSPTKSNNQLNMFKFPTIGVKH